ncbi:MAG: hypothetical protein QXT84_03965 [Candidatus Bathyarchaeia archaeon]
MEQANPTGKEDQPQHRVCYPPCEEGCPLAPWDGASYLYGCHFSWVRDYRPENPVAGNCPVCGMPVILEQAEGCRIVNDAVRNHAVAERDGHGGCGV